MENFDSFTSYLVAIPALVVVIYLTKRFFAGGVCTSKARLDGKTVIITGANTGIGKETAVDLAKRGARVILACRDKSRADKAADDIRKESGNGNVVVDLLDLESLQSIKSFANKINSREERVDILINNAGIMACPYWKTKDGFEMQIGVNHLGHFFLTNLLLDKIKKSAPSRIINVSSLAHTFGKMKWDDLNSEKSYNSWLAYGQSKLCNILFTRELAKRLQGTGVTAYANHPGSVRTELLRHTFKVGSIFAFMYDFIFYPITWIFMKSPVEGAQTTIYLAVDESLNNTSGKYYSDCKEKKPTARALNDDDAARLWKWSEEAIKSKIEY